MLLSLGFSFSLLVGMMGLGHLVFVAWLDLNWKGFVGYIRRQAKVGGLIVRYMILWDEWMG